MSQTATGSHPAASWSTVEFVVTSDSPTGRHGTPGSRLLARLLYQALVERDRRSVTLLALSGHQRERYLLRSRTSANSDTGTELLASLAHDTLPLKIGISIVDVDPAPLGKTPVPAHRLLTTRDIPVERRETPTPTPFEQLLNTVKNSYWLTIWGHDRV